MAIQSNDKHMSERSRSRAKRGLPSRGRRAPAVSPAAPRLPAPQVPFAGRPRVVDVTDRKRVVASRLDECAVECTDEDRDALLYYLARRRHRRPHARRHQGRSPRGGLRRGNTAGAQLTAHRGRTLVFVNAISAVRRVAALLALLRVPHAALHAQMQQRQRLKAMDRFKRSPADGERTVALVATDVAARGLDISDVRTVVHYQARALTPPLMFAA